MVKCTTGSDVIVQEHVNVNKNELQQISNKLLYQLHVHHIKPSYRSAKEKCLFFLLSYLSVFQFYFKIELFNRNTFFFSQQDSNSEPYYQ